VYGEKEKKIAITGQKNEEPRKMPNPNITTASHHLYSNLTGLEQNRQITRGNNFLQ